MNILTSCNYGNCYLQFKNVMDYISHYESKHLSDVSWRRIQEVEELDKALENAKDQREKERIQEHLNNLYNHPLRMSLFFKLNPYSSDHVVIPQEKKSLALQFTNYRRRPAPNPPSMPVTPKKVAKHTNSVTESSSIENNVDEKKHHCTVEGCKKSYKNSAGLRHHMRSFHNISAQQQNRVSPAPNYSATSNAHIAFVPTNQGYYAQKEEIKTAADISANPNSSGGSIGSLATFNTTTSRLHGSEDGFVQSGQNNGTNYRPGSRLTPSEENILNRNLTNVLPAPHRSSTPSSANQTRARMQDGKFKCEYCPKAYKANANLQKHINEHHPRQAGQDTSSVQRPVLSKNVLRTYSIGSNQPSGGGTALTSQQSQVSSVPQQNKTNLLSAKSNVVHGGVSRSPVSPGGMMSPNLPPAPSVSVQSSGQRQIAIGGQSNVQQRTYLQTRTYAHSQPQTQNQPIYTLQQIQQQSSGPDNTPQSLDIQIPQGQTSSSPRNYGSSPVTVVLQSHQQQSSTGVQGQQHVTSEHYQPSSQITNVRPRTYTSQQYYERYQNSVQRRPVPKGYGSGSYAYPPKQIKQAFRQPGQDYPRLGASSGMSRVNTISSTGQPVRITSLSTQSGGSVSSVIGSGHLSNSSIIGGSPSSQLPTTYQVRTNFGSGNLSSQLAPLNVNYGGTTATTSIDGIQITKVTPSQYGNPPRIRGGAAVRGRLPDNIRGGHAYSQGIPRYSGTQGMPQYSQRIMRVVQNPGGSNPPVLQQEQGSQRVAHLQNTSQSSTEN